MRALFLVGLLLGCASSASAQVKVGLDADRTELSVGEALTVQVTVESQGRAAPEVEMPDFNGFEVLQQRVSRPMQFSFSFGSQPQVFKSSANYLFVLQPLAPGRYTLGPAQVRVGNQVVKSRALQINVLGAAQGTPQAAPQTPQQDPGAATAQAPVRATNDGILDGAVIDEAGFLRTVVSRGKPYEGEQLTVTQYLYVPERLQSPPRIVKEASTDGLWTQDLLDPQRQLESSTQNVQGKLFRAYVLRRFAAFPLRSGEITLGAMQVEVDRSSVFDLFGRGRPQGNLQLSSVPLTLEVKPLPDAGRPAGEIAVGRYALSARVDRAETVTGEAVKLTAKVEGQGNLRTVALATPQLPDIDILQPQVRDLMQVQGGVVQGTRQFEWLLVPKQPGQLTLPPLVLQTFDPASERYVELKSEALSLRVAGNALPPPAASAPGPAAEAPAAPDRVEAPSVPAERWPTLRTRSELARSTPRVVDQAWYAGLLALGPLLWLGILIGSALRTRLAARAQLDGPERNRKQARQKLGLAEHAAKAGDATALHAACAAAIHEQLEARLGENTLGVSRAQLRQMLEARGIDSALAADILAQLEHADFARFGAAQSASAVLGAEVEKVRKLVARIDAAEGTARP